MTKQSKRVALYARVSTESQTTDNQLIELRKVAERMGWIVVGEFVDHAISGGKGRDQRPAFDKLQKGAIRKDYELIMAWSIDRLGRSLRDLVNFLGDIQTSKVDLYLHQQGINTETPTGRLMFQMIGMFAEFEKCIIKERVISGIARSKITGTKSGKPHGRPANLENPEPHIRKLRAEGLGMLKIAKQLSIGVSTVQRVLATT
ncbi:MULTISPECIES: recombinase family protein [Methylotenera]|uniref:recombinase family protein n=1 Tax=Methylotenera TaxID=359407 RepID=UPI000364C89B|nr:MULTISPECIES: recombinase family protein [Methylotenera]